MTRLLSTYLRLGLEEPGAAETKRIVEALPRELTAYHDGKIEPVRELLLSTAIESTTLIQSEMYATVQEGAKFAQVMRNAVPVFQMKANQLSFPYGATGTYAGKVAEGAEIPIANQDYNIVSFTAQKYGVRPVITKEMVEDSLYDAIGMEVRYAGESVENSLNQLMLTELLDGAGNEHDASGSDLGIKSVSKAIGLIKADHFKPDTIVMAPEFETGLRGELPLTSYPGAESVSNGGAPPTMGLRSFVCDVADDSSTYTWEYNSDGDIGAVVFDSRKCGGIGMRRDITIERYADPIRDLMGMSVSARFDADTVFANAISRIEY
jgi:hypothetical protein